MLRDLGNYFAGRVVLLLLGLISFPLMARLLSVQDFGSVSLVLRGVMLCTVLSKCGLQHAAARFFEHGAESKAPEQQDFFSTLTFGPLFTSAFLAAICWLTLFALRLRFSDRGLFLCLCVAPGLVIARTLQTVMLTLWRNEGRSRLHTALETSAKVLTLGGLALMFCTGMHSPMLVLATLLACEGCVVLLQWIMLRREKQIRAAAVSRNIMRQSLAFGAPLILYELSSLVLDSGDRVLIRVYAGGVALGLYSAAYNIAGYVQDALMTPLNLAITPIYMRIWRQQGSEATQAFLSRALTWFAVAAFAVTGLVSVTSSDVIVLLASRRFAEAHRLLPVLVPGLMLYAVHIFLNVGLILSKRTMLMAGMVSASAVLNLLLNLLLIPHYGSLGSAWATLLSDAVFVGWLAWVNRKLLPLRVGYRVVAESAFAAALTAWAVGHVRVAQVFAELCLRGLAFSVLFVVLLTLVSKQFRRRVQQEALRWKSRSAAPVEVRLVTHHVVQGDQS